MPPNQNPLAPPSFIEPPTPKWYRSKLAIAAGVIGLLVLTGGGFWWLGHSTAPQNKAQVAHQESHQDDHAESELPQNTTAPVSELQLESTKQYGNKYANGLLPVGDNQYTTDAPKKGSLYLCKANFVPASQAGAQTRGPWFTNNNTQWDINKKAIIQGKVDWPESLTVKVEGGKRILTTNDLPDHHTGTYPVGSSDPAKVYDANPNTISAQSLTYSLTASPKLLSKPACMGGEVGIMLTGSVLFNAFDAGGRDAGAWEVQDSCDGHPQGSGIYHYHTLSRCIKDVSVQKVIGFALDGLPITGPKVSDGNFLTTDDLDECHGITSKITLDGKEVTSYHYVMTQDFPYSVSCFRATAAQSPAQHQGGGQQGQQGSGSQPPSGGQVPSTGSGQKPPQNSGPQPSGGSKPAPPPGGGMTDGHQHP